MVPSQASIVIRGAREHNLQNVSLEIPRDQLVVVSGLSGSGKSSLAFDTIYAEGQRRYLESLSAYARQFMGQMSRPDVDYIGGLSPVIAIGQKSVSRNPRSSVGTVTEVYDFLRLLFARVGTPVSPVTGEPLRKQTTREIVESILTTYEGMVSILAPIVRGRKGHYRERFARIAQQGFTRVVVDGTGRVLRPGMQLDRYKTHDIEVVVDRIRVAPKERDRIQQSVETALAMGSGVLQVAAQGQSLRVFSTHLFDPETGTSFREASPGLFSFNSSYGACTHCKGIGTITDIAEEDVIPDRSLSIIQGGIAPLRHKEDNDLYWDLERLVRRMGCDTGTPLNKYPEGGLDVLLYGKNKQKALRAWLNDPYVRVWRGLFFIWRRWLRRSTEEGRHIRKFARPHPCPECKGARLRPGAPQSYQIAGKTIGELVEMDLVALDAFIRSTPLSPRQKLIATPIIKEITDRLGFMIAVGVEYLTLNRSARTLSGGESQRIRLATQIGTQLTGVLYVLDEPSIGLHSRDNRRLIDSLRQLRDLGNSVLVVEHDRDMIEGADYLVDLGPGAGERGGHVVCAGRPGALEVSTNGKISYTAEYLAGLRSIEVPRKRRRAMKRRRIILEGATGHNLKGDTLELPLGLFICVTGVSGSGKSSLINQTLQRILQRHLHRAYNTSLPYGTLKGLKYVDKVIAIDQKPIGRTPRSNPATYTGILTPLRDLFASHPDALIRGFSKSRFSFNVKGGRCEDCEGAGLVRLEMNFLPDVFVLCDTCRGQRYNKETLEVKYRGKSIADILNMSVDEAAEFFTNLPRIGRRLEMLKMVGLGYIRLGQQSTTISGGEAQRVKLAKELMRPGTGDTLYVLDEPTTGLHFEDIRYLLSVLQALVDKGNTVVIIEHNMDVVKVADYIIDMGPEGGAAGGHILFAGTPEALAEQDTYTGAILREVLQRA